MADFVDKFSPHLNAALTRALTLVLEEGGDAITPEHLFWAVGTEEGCLGAELMKKSGISREAFSAFQKEKNSKQKKTEERKKPFLSDDAKAAMEKAMLTANLHDHALVTTEHLLFGLLAVRTAHITAFLKTANITSEHLEEELQKIFRESRAPSLPAEVRPASVRTEKKTQEPCTKCGHIHDPVEEGEEQSALEFFSKELTGSEHVKTIDGLVGREKEVERLARILTRRMKNNPLLLGEPGVGKTAIVEGLAKRIAEGKAPAALQDTKIYMLDMASLLAGTMYRGDFEARLSDVLDDLKEQKNAVLFIDEIHTLVGAGASAGALDAANIMKPALSRGEIRVIGATTHDEYRKHIADDGALSRRFAPITVHEPTAEETLIIMKGLAPAYAKHHGVTFSSDALKTIVDISGRYFPHKCFPDKSLDLLDEIGSACRGKKLEITPEDIRALSASITGVPLETLTADEETGLRTLAERMKKHVVAQDETVDAVAQSIIRAKLGFTRTDKPLATFLFVGPSGVGKTEMAKAVAREVFEDEKALIRFDMSEYAESHSTSKLIGSPPGYVGYKDAARLTDAVKERPYAVILFDELEKAHRDVHHLLLQVLDEGMLTDAVGHPVNFRNTVIIMTSNAGREELERGTLGFQGKRGKLTEDVRSALEESFSAEFLNRIDRICRFSSLTPKDLAKIVKRDIDELARRLAKRGITLSAEKKAIDVIAGSLNPKLGARDIRRAVTEQVEKPLAERVLTDLKRKNKRYAVKAEKGSVKIHG